MVCDIHSMFLKVLKTEHQLRNERDSEEHTFRQVILGTDKDQVRVDCCFKGPRFQECEGVHMDQLAADMRASAATALGDINMHGPSGAEGAKGDKQMMKTKAEHYHNLHAKMAIWTFLSNTRWKATAEGKNGSSWIELMIVFQIMGGNCEPKPRDVQSLCPSTSFRQQLLFFMKVFKQTVTMYMGESDKCMFKPARTSGFRLGAYGVNHHVPCILAEICLMDTIQAQLHIALASLLCNLSNAKLRDLHKGQLCISKRKLSMRGPTPWTSKIVCSDVVNKLVDKLISSASDADVAAMPQRRPSSFYITCHICGHGVEARNRSLIKNGLWGIVACSVCQANRKASKWLCTCGVPWYTCASHRIQGLACRAIQRFSRVHDSALKGKICPLGVLGKPRTKRRRPQQGPSLPTGPRLNRGDEGTSHRRLRWKQPDPSRDGGLIDKGAQTDGSSCLEAGVGVPGNETGGRHILIDQTRKRVYPQRGSNKRQKLSDPLRGGISIAKVVARNANLARKFPHLRDRPPE